MQKRGRKCEKPYNYSAIADIGSTVADTDTKTKRLHIHEKKSPTSYKVGLFRIKTGLLFPSRTHHDLHEVIVL